VNISEAEAGNIVGGDLIARLKELTLEIYRRGAAHAESKGIIVADTKFEFGLAPAGPSRRSPDQAKADEVILIDEVLTPDSSRFWPQAQYKPGQGQPSFDKQYVRDYLEEIRWNKQPPVPSLPDEVIRRTREKYVDAYRVLTDRELR
jgi:phosphoribosylaminoimidazole-succinocarboxamide synthase